ncbi:MAG: Gfo/Idh/MocA family oxidoreductase [Candidatus Omnitrophota bacterium]
MAKLKVGIIGLGAIASSHIKAINAIRELRLHSVCRRNKEELDKFCKEYRVKGFTDYRKLLEEGVDIAVVAVPHHLHYEAGMKALDCGCHLVMEKPFAISIKQCRDLYQKAKEGNLKIVTADSSYYLPRIRKAREIINSGKLGRFISGGIINYKNYFTPNRPVWFLEPELAGGGQLLNVGVHRVGLVRALIGSGEITVKASVGFFQPNCRIEGNGSIFIGYGDGSAVMLEENGYYKLNPHLEKCCHFNFENGVINLSGKFNVIYKNGAVEYYEADQAENRPYLPHYQEIVSAIKENRTPYPGAKEGILDVKIILAAYESAKTGKEVRLDNARWNIK